MNRVINTAAVEASVARGMAQSAAGEVEYLGDFSQYAVSDAAVEAGVEALAEHDPWRPGDKTGWYCDCGDTFRDRRGAREHQARAALTAALPHLAAVPSATREDEVDGLAEEIWETSRLDTDESEGLARALLARFTITPRTDR